MGEGARRMFLERLSEAPRVFDAAAAGRLKDALGAGFDALDARAQALLMGVGGASPYLSRLIARAPARLFEILADDPARRAADLARRALAAGDIAEPAALMRALRALKDEAALLSGLAEAGGVWDSLEAAAALSAFADAAMNAALRSALARLEPKGFRAAGAAACERLGGVAVIAMGKLGAVELNYSSDIDLIVLFDPESPAFEDADAAPAVAVAAAKELVRLLGERTAEGYVFRVDLRLRPDPGVTPAAISVRAAETYYEAHGQNWERAAFIKARAAAGDLGVGEAFLARLRPYVWRKYLDFAAIEDIHSIKRQIHAARGGAGIEFFGHDLKTGRGGIREIEFLAQTQQLILGGKQPRLRERATLAALSRLAEAGRMSETERDELAANYRYLRRVEHRLQMINDEQTHKIPKDEEGAARLAAFLGEDNVAAFERRLAVTLTSTHAHFAALFEKEERLSTDVGSLIFTGVENDKATIATLTRLGFSRPSDVSDVIRRWHAGSLRATRSPRARELLTKLAPKLLEALSKAGDPDAAFVAFDGFLSRLPGGVQIFSLFANNPEIFDVLIRIMTIAPELGRQLSKRAHLVEALLEANWPRPPASPSEIRGELAERLDRHDGYEAKLNAARRWGAEKRFDAAAQLVIGAIDAEAAARQFSAIAEAAIAELLPVARAETERDLGAIEGGLAVIGLGRLGQRAMTAASDVDLIFVYDAPEGAQSRGRRPVDAPHYFMKLVRRLLAALAAVTEEGALFEVDMKLRPSGGAGPAAVSLKAFRTYYEQSAWTFELMALVKARVVAGASDVGERTRAVVAAALTRPRARGPLAADVDDMRRRLADAKTPQSPFDVRHAAGGLADLDFALEFLALVEGARLGVPPPATRDLVGFLAEGGALAENDAAGLISASETFETIMQLGRAATGTGFVPEASGEALRERMAAALGARAIADAEEALVRRQDVVREFYERCVAGAAGEAARR
jgi:glutamate-ammonia-ligase adenylyltransferase